jgi:hypothetical protein
VARHGGHSCAAFGKGQFESGVAARVLREFAQDPFPYLDEAEKKEMMASHSGLLRKFTELAIDESAEVRSQESRPMEAVIPERKFMLLESCWIL